MGAAYVAGFAAAYRRWPIVLLLFAGSLLAGLSFSAATWSWLSMALGKSLATRSLLTDLNVQVFIDLFAHHSESLNVLLLTGLGLALISALVGIWLNAVAIAAVADDGSTSQCLGRGWRLYPTYLGLWALTYLCLLALGLAVLIGARALTRWTAESTSEMTFYWIAGGGLLVAAIVWLVLSAVHDHARIRTLATGAGAPRAFAWALMFVLRRESRAVLLSTILLASSIAFWVLYQGVAALISTNSALGVTLSLLEGEVLLLGRMFLRVWWFAAAADLQLGSEPAAHWAARNRQRSAA